MIPRLAEKRKSDASGGSVRLFLGSRVGLDMPHVQLQAETANVEVEVLGRFLFLEVIDMGLGLMDSYVLDLTPAMPFVVGP